MRLLTLILVFLAVLPLQAKHSDHSIGVHGMALMWVDGKVLASHMPLHHGKHAVQLVVELKPQPEQLQNIKTLFRDYELVSLMPETFSLTELRQGKITHFSGTVFGGHFERGGKALLKNVRFTVGEQLLNEQLIAQDNGTYHVISLNSQLSLLVHRIGDKPSFDQIVLAKRKHQDVLPSEIQLKTQKPLTTLSNEYIEIVAPLYLETQDFK